MLDELAGWGVAVPAVVADAGYGEISAFRAALAEPSWPTWSRSRARPAPTPPGAEQPPWRGSGRRPARRYRAAPSTLRELALAAGREATTAIAWREGSRGPMSSRFLALPCRPANIALRRTHKNRLPAAWLLAEWPDGQAEPLKYWLSNLPEATDLGELVCLAKLRWRIELDYRELKDALGLDHFEGRSFRGWHHHVTLVSAAHAFLTLQRLDPKAAAPA